jgi:hypothetical protein
MYDSQPKGVYPPRSLPELRLKIYIESTSEFTPLDLALRGPRNLTMVSRVQARAANQV